MPARRSGRGDRACGRLRARLTQVACENQLPGDPTSDWFVNGAGDPSIQGFATVDERQRGSTISFKINTPSTAYHIDILRTGYYQGNGARKIVSRHDADARRCRRTNRACLSDCLDRPDRLRQLGRLGVVDGAGRRGLGRLRRAPDARRHCRAAAARSSSSSATTRSHSDIVYQTSDTTWEAYNTYGGNSLYVGQPGRHAGVQGLVQPAVQQR